jgi:hypothetical protein
MAAGCPLCGAMPDAKSSFVSFRRPDGSAGMIDQPTLSYLRSPNPEPSQSDLEELFRRTSHVQIMELEFQGQKGLFQPKIALHEREKIDGLQNALTIQNAGGHLMTFGHVRFDLYANSDLIAHLQVVRPSVLRWSDRWNSDAVIMNPGALAEFLKSQGFPRLYNDLAREKVKNH